MDLYTLLTIAAVVALVAYVAYRVYWDLLADYGDTTVEIFEEVDKKEKRRGKIRDEQKEVRLRHSGTHTFVNSLKVDVEIIFEVMPKYVKPPLNTYKIRGPFPAEGSNRRGIYRLGPGDTKHYQTDIEGSRRNSYWKYKVKDGDGNTIDPGIRVKR